MSPQLSAEQVTEAEERRITREVLLLIAELHPLHVEGGRIVPPADASAGLIAKIRQFEGELLWSRGFESGPRWGCAPVPAVSPKRPVIEREGN
jgi:hypothetical protein